MKEFMISILNFLGLAWWVEIATQTPKCTYYFGPFLSQADALAAQAGYLEDLEQEGAQGVKTSVRRCKPTHLTVSDDLGEFNAASRPIFSGQM
ncbi:MAG: DUF1816 domain-containing protein [Desertifilum sp.]|nr:DUF1816 domain-containing protein [Desertifilum sp.]NES97507.1 DUF1816 domain-containing protein [Desertifilum sp. SIO1I2]